MKTGEVAAKPSIEYEGLVFSQEGADVRVTSASLNYLFGKSNPKAMFKAYKNLEARTHKHFRPRWQSFTGLNLKTSEFLELLRNIVLNDLYLYAVNGIPVWMVNFLPNWLVRVWNWNHPDTRDIIERFVDNRFSRYSPEATQLCAHLMGLTEEGYLKWSKNWSLFWKMRDG